jgi:hypothetical protein
MALNGEMIGSVAPTELTADVLDPLKDVLKRDLNIMFDNTKPAPAPAPVPKVDPPLQQAKAADALEKSLSQRVPHASTAASSNRFAVCLWCLTLFSSRDILFLQQQTWPPAHTCSCSSSRRRNLACASVTRSPAFCSRCRPWHPSRLLLTISRPRPCSQRQRQAGSEAWGRGHGRGRGWSRPWWPAICQCDVF